MRGLSAMRPKHCGNDWRFSVIGCAAGMAYSPAFRQRAGSRCSRAPDALMREAAPPECCRRQFKTENSGKGAGPLTARPRPLSAFPHAGVRAGLYRQTACKNNS